MAALELELSWYDSRFLTLHEFHSCPKAPALRSHRRYLSRVDLLTSCPMGHVAVAVIDALYKFWRLVVVADD